MTSFSVLNWNIAHGRNKKSAVFPPRVGREEVQSNLKKIADCIRERDADIVTLQEVDECSVLSGSLNQFKFLNERLGYPHAYYAPTCSATLFGIPLFVSGNAILSRFPLENREAINFDFSFPTERKGFVIADVRLPDGSQFSAVSVHIVWIDWMRRDSRAYQLNTLREIVVGRKSMIIAGDLNADFLGKEVSLRPFVQTLDLKAYEPESTAFDTYHSANLYERTDWILVSKDMRFHAYETVPDILSDHLAVFSRLSI